MSHMLEVRGLSKSFGKHRVLNKLDLELPEGRVYGLLGKNGEGKTTLIRTIMGVIPADRGDIFFNGKRIDFHHADYKRDIGLIAEDCIFYRRMSIRELIAFNAAFYPKWNRRKAADLLKRFGLKAEMKVGRMSRGMKLKLGLIIALAAEPRLLLLDDPTSGLDVPTRRDFMRNLIGEIMEAGTTILFSTHLVHEIEGIVETLGILQGGNLMVEEEFDVLKAGMRRVEITASPEQLKDLRFEHALSDHRTDRGLEAVVSNWDDSAAARLAGFPPGLVEVTPLTLEEIFIAWTEADQGDGS